jgi:hypothetical protein
MRHLPQGEPAHAYTPCGKSISVVPTLSEREVEHGVASLEITAVTCDSVAFVDLRAYLTDIALLHFKTSMFMEDQRLSAR